MFKTCFFRQTRRVRDAAYFRRVDSGLSHLPSSAVRSLVLERDAGKTKGRTFYRPAHRGLLLGTK